MTLIRYSQPLLFLLSGLLFLISPIIASAATLGISPNTGVYVAGKTFTAKVLVNSAGKPINAAEGTISFNPNELSVVSIDKSGSIFNLWVTEPTFSNSAGTISFSGGLPSGYTGAAGTVFNINFRTTSAGTARVSMTSGSVLANDGMGTNVLTNMSGGTFTIQAPSAQPIPEVIEYVAPANTPSAPAVQSSSHPDSSGWSTKRTAELSWTLPSGVVAVRTALDNSASSIPTKVYDNPIRNITLSDLSDGVSYFHIQFKNNEGWGKVAHYRLGIDTQKPESFVISQAEDVDLTSPIQTIKLDAKDGISGIVRYSVKIDDQESYEFIDKDKKNTHELPSLLPGYHSVVIEAFDGAGNSILGTYSFNILAFDRPVFTDYPKEINEEVIPVIRGLTRQNSEVEVTVHKIGAEPAVFTVTADSEGVFTFIPEGTFTTGVYELSARATDQFGAKSDASETIRIAVQQPGYLRIGSMLISILSVIVPLVGMSVLLLLSVWFLVSRSRRFRRKVSFESSEAIQILNREFSNLHELLKTKELDIVNSRKTKKLTQAEEEMILALTEALTVAETRVKKEIVDVEQIVQNKH